MTAKQKFDAFKKSYTEAKQKMQDEAGAAFKELAADFFEKFPKVNSFAWTQYTPYWNDGEQCQFGVNNDSYSIFLNGGNADYDEDYEEGQELDDATDSKASEAVSKFLQQFDDEILQDLYGDHCKVTVNRDGTAETEEYEHD